MKNITDQLQTASDFLNFYQSVPDNAWHVGDYTDENDNCRCALGLVGKVKREGPHQIFIANENTSRIIDLVCAYEEKTDSKITISAVNDGTVSKYSQATPKERVISFCKSMVAAGL